MSNYLQFAIAPHREYLPAQSSEQRLFVMLRLRPSREIAQARPDTAFIAIIDTSGSMIDKVAGSKTKIDIVIESLESLLDSTNPHPRDRLSLIQFDTSASEILPLTSLTEISKIKDALKLLRGFSGSTYLENGLRIALSKLSDLSMTNRHILLFTDGLAFDEDACLDLATKFASENIPITAIGVGDEFNEDLLNRLSDAAGGRAFHVVTNNAIGTQVAIADLPKTVLEEFTLAQTEVITNLNLGVKTVQGVQLKRVMRAYPSFTEFSAEKLPCAIGNAPANEETVMILEFSIATRPPSRLRIAQVGITYDVPGANRVGELPPQDLVVQFVDGDEFAVQVDPDVMHYVQQCNLDRIVNEATKVAESNPERAEQLLESARRMTQNVGNKSLSESLSSAQDELRKTRNISSGTRKTIKMGSKGKTVKMAGGFDEDPLISEEEIQRAMEG
jgi:Ca-activated chloride channel family protein